MEHAAGVASVAVVLAVAVLVDLARVPGPSLTDPLWYLVVATGLAYWVGMLYWSR